MRNLEAAAQIVLEVKQIRNISVAQQAYAKQAKNKQLEIDAVEIRMRAGRRLGELMDDQKRTVGVNRGVVSRDKKGLTRGAVGTPRIKEPPTLADAGIDKHLAKQARQLARLPKEKFEDCIQKWRQGIENNGNRVTTAFIRQMRDDEKKAELHLEEEKKTVGLRGPQHSREAEVKGPNGTHYLDAPHPLSVPAQRKDKNP